jgi:hypothetical protein
VELDLDPNAEIPDHLSPSETRMLVATTRRGIASATTLIADERTEMEADSSDMGPVDYLLVEWPGRQPNGEVAPHLLDLVDRGLVRIIDLTFLTKAEDGTIAALEIGDLGGEVAELSVFEGASSGLLSEDDLKEAGSALEPGTSAALLVYENRWAASFAAAVRASGGQLVARGHIDAEDLVATLDTIETTA